MENNTPDTETQENTNPEIMTDIHEEADTFQDELSNDEEMVAAPESTEAPDDLEMELDYFDPEKQEDKLWRARTGLNTDSLCGAIETIIFMSDRPVHLNKIRTLIDEELPLRVLHEAITRLQDEYESAHHGLRLVEVAEGFQFRTKATYSKYVQDLFKVSSLVLSPTALEVMAIIAYKQPVSKVEVEKIRGVDSSHIVRGLMDKRLVKVVGRSDELGRPVLYGTTPEFLEVFNLANLDQLPPEHELQSMLDNQVGKISDIKELVSNGENAQFSADEIDELDQLSDSIKSIASDTDFTKSIKVEEKKRVNEAGEAVKSAFDLLEDFLNNKQSSDQNKLAQDSEMMLAPDGPTVISDLSAGPFNVPREEDDFEMIDLDTGDVITNEADTDLEEFDAIIDIELDSEEDAQALVASTEDDADAEFIQLFDDGPSDDEKQSLSDALDEAFEKLTGESLEDLVESFSTGSDVDEEDLMAKEQQITELTEEMAAKAGELDIDLNFLQEDADDNLTPEQ